MVHFGPCVSWAYCMYSMGLGAYIEDFSGNHVVTHGTMAGLIQATDGGQVLMYYPHLDVPVTWGTAAVEAWGDVTSVVWWPHAATAANATGVKYTVTDYNIVGDAGEKFPGTIPGASSYAFQEKLNADRTYYVRTDGNDTNNGKANTAGGAWATIDYALRFISSYIDLNGKVVTIQLNDGTHAGVSFSRFIRGGGVIFIKGHATDTTSVVISGTTTAGIELGGHNPSIAYYIGGVKLESTYSYPLSVFGNRVFLGSPDGSTNAVRFGKGASSFWPMIALTGPTAYCTTWATGTTIDVDSATYPVGYFIQTNEGAQASFGSVAFASTTTFTTAFVQADKDSLISINTADGVAGSAVGKRYEAINGGVIRRTSGTGGIDNLPGTIAGTWTSAIKNLISPVTLSDTTASTSSTTGALKVAGGVGIAGDVNIGGILTTNGSIKSSTTTTTFLNSDGSDRSDFYCKAINAISIVPLTANIPSLVINQVWNNAAVNFRALRVDCTDTASGADTRLLSLHIAGNVKFHVLKDGSMVSASTAAATSATTGSIITAGGAGIGGDLYVAGKINVGGGDSTGKTTISTSAPSGGADGDVWYQYT